MNQRQILSDGEARALLDAVSGETADRDSSGAASVASRLPRLDHLNDRFAKTFRVTLSNAMRRMANVTALKTGTMEFLDAMRSLPCPSAVVVVKMDGLPGNMTVSFEPNFVHALIDSFFGGNSVPYTRIEGKDFTGIEMDVLGLVARSFFDDLAKVWAPIHALSFEKIGEEVFPMRADFYVDASEEVLHTTFEVEFEKLSTNFHVTIPLSALDSIREKLQSPNSRQKGDQNDK